MAVSQINLNVQEAAPWQHTFLTVNNCFSTVPYTIS
jgi:hypothetical protein